MVRVARVRPDGAMSALEGTAMRKIILMMSVSLDGFIEGPDRELDWHMVDDELHSHFNEQLSAMGAFLNGRVTYELMAGFWPTADTDPSSTGPMVEFARIWRDMPKIVFSRTLERADWNTTVVRDLVAEEVMEVPLIRDSTRGDRVTYIFGRLEPCLGGGQRCFRRGGLGSYRRGGHVGDLPTRLPASGEADRDHAVLAEFEVAETLAEDHGAALAVACATR